MIRTTTRLLALLVIALLSTTTPAAAAAPPPLDAATRGFLQKHCLECHGPVTQERGLRFDQLMLDLDNSDNAQLWTKTLDKVAAGQMPPADQPRPTAAEVQSFAQSLRGRLQAASLAHQQREGRVLLRRLNRNEYETTLRDLLGLQVQVKDLLPEDNIAAGFDNVSAALEISPVHLLRYQEAAEKAIRSVIPARSPSPIDERRNGRVITEKYGNVFKDVLGKFASLDGDSLVMYSRLYGHTPCASAPVPQRGRYRVTASIRSVQSGGRTLPIMLSGRIQYGRSDANVVDVLDLPPDQQVTYSSEFDLDTREMIVIVPWDLPSAREFSNKKLKTLEGYDGPGVAVDWIEITGPLDPFPSNGYRRLFGDVPLLPESLARLQAAGRTEPPELTEKYQERRRAEPLIAASKDPKADAERLIRALLPVAFRRPVDEPLAQYFVNMAQAKLDEGVPFFDAMVVAYTAVFCSPHFLYLTEPFNESQPTNRTALDDHAIAARLAYFFWSSTPDDELRRLADEGKLTASAQKIPSGRGGERQSGGKNTERSEPARLPLTHSPTLPLSSPAVQPNPNLRAQVERMLNDPKAKRFRENFTGQWLDLRNINATSPDPAMYGEFDDFLFWSMPQETQRFFNEVLDRDLPLTNFVDSKWSMLNQRLGQHYGIPGIVGATMRRVELPDGSVRGGVLTQASILKVTADGSRTSPVLRGKWVLERIIGLPPEPPPPDVPAIEPDIRGATTIRQQLDKHRNTVACAGCHKQIDPPGFALESFDPIGGWREFYRVKRDYRFPSVPLANYPGQSVSKGPDVEVACETADGRHFATTKEYKQLLLADKDQLARSLATKLIIYATGAEPHFADREVIEQLVAQSRGQNYGFRSLIHAVVQSRVFLNK